MYTIYKKLLGKNTKDLHEMLHQKGVNWNDLEDNLKRGTYFGWEIKKYCEDIKLTSPAEHRQVVKLKLPPLGSIVNRVDVLFNGAEVLIADKED